MGWREELRECLAETLHTKVLRLAVMRARSFGVEGDRLLAIYSGPYSCLSDAERMMAREGADEVLRLLDELGVLAGQDSVGASKGSSNAE